MVDPASMSTNFNEILKKPVIASSVQTEVKLHKGFEFRNEEDVNLSTDKTCLTRKLGNVTDESEFTFEYTLKSLKDLL